MSQCLYKKTMKDHICALSTKLLTHLWEMIGFPKKIIQSFFPLLLVRVGCCSFLNRAMPLQFVEVPLCSFTLTEKFGRSSFPFRTECFLSEDKRGLPLPVFVCQAFALFHALLRVFDWQQLLCTRPD